MSTFAYWPDSTISKIFLSFYTENMETTESDFTAAEEAALSGGGADMDGGAAESEEGHPEEYETRSELGSQDGATDQLDSEPMTTQESDKGKDESSCSFGYRTLSRNHFT